jgi:nickel-dependent lactate racemase
VATGIHRPPTANELRDILGEEISSSYAVISHNARDGSAIKRLGFTGSGIPMDINKLYVESDLKVVVGLVEPHFMAGFSGGRKSIAVGLTSVDAIRHLHGPALLEQAHTRNCSLKRNLLHGELMEIATAAAVDMSVNVVMDAERRIGGVFVGDLMRSHREACVFASQYVSEPGAGLFDIVVTTSAGHPLDATYYQAVKGLVGVLDILKPGGSIIIAAECRNGLGSAEFCSMLEVLHEIGDYDLFLKRIADPRNFCIDQWEVEMLVKALRKAKIYLFSDKLAQGDYALAQARPIPSVEAGMEHALSDAGPHARVAVVPEGPYFVPMSGKRSIKIL